MILNSGHISSIGNGVWIAELNDLEKRLDNEYGKVINQREQKTKGPKKSEAP